MTNTRTQWSDAEIEILVELYGQDVPLKFIRNKLYNKLAYEITNKAISLKLKRNIIRSTHAVGRDLSFDNLKEIASKFKCSKDFYTNDNSAYIMAKQKGFYEEITKHFLPNPPTFLDEIGDNRTIETYKLLLSSKDKNRNKKKEFEEFWLKRNYLPEVVKDLAFKFFMKTVSEEELKKTKQCSNLTVDYWTIRGYSLDQAIAEVSARQKYNANAYYSSTTKDERAYKNVTCKEYWMSRHNMTEEEAIRKISERQSTFSLEKCIEKHGEVEGTKIWQARQDKWQDNLNSKPQDEKDEINRKRSRFSFVDRYSETDVVLYLFKMPNNQIKVGITSKESISERYSPAFITKCEILYEKAFEGSFALGMEYFIKDKFSDFLIPQEEQEYKKVGYTETFSGCNPQDILNFIEEKIVEFNV